MIPLIVTIPELFANIVPNELTKDEYNYLQKENDSVCNNLLEKYYVLEDNVYKIISRTRKKLHKLLGDK